jgi:prepilin-type N-terminal cleavage/methylation domain-containing protein
MLTKIKTRKDGFTIVEIMIVMAIIGLMLLAMLLVVPALRRNQRNKQRRDDVGSLITGMGEYATNNSGALPTNATQFGQVIGTLANNYTDGLARLGYYDPQTEVDYLYSTSAAATPTLDASRVYVRNYAKCNGSTMTTTGATRRNVVVLFSVETSGATAPQCQES